MEKKPVRTAVIPVAGRGTRFLPITKAVPKELLPLVDTPVLQHIVQEAAGSGIKKIILVTSPGKGAIEEYFNADFARSNLQGAEILCVRQENPLGLGHAILCARKTVGDEPFAVLLGDDVIDGDIPCTKQLIDTYQEKNGAPVVGVMEVSRADVNKYGIVGGKNIADGLMQIETLVEKPDPAHAPSHWAIPGRYILTPALFDILMQAKPSVGGEIQLTDSLAVLAGRTPMYAKLFKGQRFDAGDRVGFLNANLHYALKRPELRDQVRKIINSLANS